MSEIANDIFDLIIHPQKNLPCSLQGKKWLEDLHSGFNKEFIKNRLLNNFLFAKYNEVKFYETSNLLMYACRENSNFAELLIEEMMLYQSMDKVTSILIQQNFLGRNSLMYACESCKFEVIAALLKLIRVLPNEATIEIFTQQCVNGMNVLMFASYYLPKAIALVLEAVELLPEITKTEIFTQHCINGANVLMYACMKRSNEAMLGLALLLEEINKLPQESKKKNFHQRSKNGTTALKLIYQNYPDEVKQLLASSSYQKNEKQTSEIFSEDGKYENNNISQEDCVPKLKTTI